MRILCDTLYVSYVIHYKKLNNFNLYHIIPYKTNKLTSKMGANNSKRSNKGERDEIRKTTVEKQKTAVSSFRDQLKSNSTAIVTKENKSNIDTMLKMTSVAEVQLERDTKPFTKSDLIAILIKLRTLKGDLKSPSDAKKMIDECNKYSVGDLNSIIRCAIYDIQVVIPNVPLIDNHQRTNSNKLVVK